MKKNSLNIFFILCPIILLISIEKANADSRYFNLTINGNYQTSYTTTYKNIQLTWGIELGLPLNQYLELSIGKSYTKDTYEYTNDYKNYLLSKGLTLPNGTLTQENDIADTYTNLSFSPNWIYVNPSVFGGFLMRNICTRDYFGNNSCENQPLTWNAGGALSIYMTQHLRLKISYRVSPSGVDTGNGKHYDESYTLGLTFSI